MRRVREKLAQRSIERPQFGRAILSWIITAASKRNPIAKVCQCKQEASPQPSKTNCQGYPPPEGCFRHCPCEELASYEGIEGLWHYSSMPNLRLGLAELPGRKRPVKVLARFQQLCRAELYYLPQPGVHHFRLISRL